MTGNDLPEGIVQTQGREMWGVGGLVGAKIPRPEVSRVLVFWILQYIFRFLKDDIL